MLWDLTRLALQAARRILEAKMAILEAKKVILEAKKAPGQIQNGLLSSVWALLDSIWEPEASIWEGLGSQKCNPKRTQQWDYQKWCFWKENAEFVHKSCKEARKKLLKKLRKTMVFEDFHLSEVLRRVRNGSRFSKQNSFQNPPTIGPKSTPNR